MKKPHDRSSKSVTTKQ